VGCRDPEDVMVVQSSSPLSQGKPRGKASRLTRGMLPETGKIFPLCLILEQVADPDSSLADPELDPAALTLKRHF